MKTVYFLFEKYSLIEYWRILVMKMLYTYFSIPDSSTYCVCQPVWLGSTSMLQVSSTYCVYQPVWLGSTSMLQVCSTYCVYKPVWLGSTSMLQVSASYCVCQPVWLGSTSMLQVRLIYGYFCKHILLFFFLKKEN